ncbi:MAG: hypothetical protein HGA45_00040 [Chloroflexales bacterium]|nr:hypothetical protein [Chloroflexales bacterium]
MTSSRWSPGRLVSALIMLIVLCAGMSGSPQQALANDIQPYRIIANVDVASAGYGGMRTTGTGSISLSGVSGTVLQALLYWQGPTNSTNATANASVSFGGATVTGTNIGFSSDNCWGFSNSQAYRADVTSQVAGNGSYALANFTKSSADINGVSLIVFYDDGDATNNRDIVLFDGNDSNFDNTYDASGWNVNLPGITYSSGSASIQLHVSDGQAPSAITEYNDPALVLNGTTLAARGAIFSGNSVPNGASASNTSGGLWDIKSFDITSALTPGTSTLALTSGAAVNADEDCLSLIVAAINLPAGAAPPSLPGPPVLPESERVAKNSALIYVVQRPTANHGTTPGSIISTEIVVGNYDKGHAKDVTITVPFDPAEVRVIDATFSTAKAWVSKVLTDSLTINTGPIGADTIITGTLRMQVVETLAPGTDLSSQLSYRWADGTDGGTGLSNTTILAVADSIDHRPTYTLSVDTPAAVAGSTFTFSSGIFAPNEPIGVWYNKPDGTVGEEAETFRAAKDGSIVTEFETPSDLPPGDYSFVLYGHWSEFTAVVPFTITK